MDEYRKWLLFLEQDEQPDVTEMQLAVLSTLVSNGLGGKAKVKDFLVRKPKANNTNPNWNGVSEKEVRGAFGMFSKKAE